MCEEKRLKAEREEKRLEAEREEKRSEAEREREEKCLEAEREEKRLVAEREREEKRSKAEREREEKRMEVKRERKHEELRRIELKRARLEFKSKKGEGENRSNVAEEIQRNVRIAGSPELPAFVNERDDMDNYLLRFERLCYSCTLGEGFVGYAAESVVVWPFVGGLFTIILERCN